MPARTGLSDAAKTVLVVAVGALALAVGAGADGDNAWWRDGVLWMLLTTGIFSIAFLVGLIFGVPRTRTAFKPSDTERYETNSNLERISDWLATLLVGATLVSVAQAPGALADGAEYLGGGFDVRDAAAYAAAAILFGAGSGFLSGYLWSRLRLRIMLENSDRVATEKSRRQFIAADLAEADSTEKPSRLREAAAAAVRLVANAVRTTPVLWIDERRERSALVRSLSSLGLEVVRVRSFAGAVALLEGRDFGVVVVDPDGIWVTPENLSALRTARPRVPIVVFGGPAPAHQPQLEFLAGLEELARVEQHASEVFTAVVEYSTTPDPQQ